LQPIAMIKDVQAPLPLAIFQRLISGDHHLLELAQQRFTDANLGAEFYAASPEELQQVLEFRPFKEPRYVIHLPRNIRLADGHGVEIIEAFASRSCKDQYGVVIHDQKEMATKPHDYSRAVKELDKRLLNVDSSPYLFIEYAAGLDPDDFVAFFEAIKDCKRISACIDIGHIGIRTAQRVYNQKYPYEDVCQLDPNHPKLPDRIADVVAASASALPAVIDVIRRIGRLGKPMHFHLHDGHPLSTFSPYGVCDHLSFFQTIHIPFEYGGQNTVPLLFGPSGLIRLVTTALEVLPRERLSFTLEIHPPYDRLNLGQYAELFSNWEDKRNAEQMNAWLEVLLLNHQLLLKACS
jgi:hypothetical protein